MLHIDNASNESSELRRLQSLTGSSNRKYAGRLTSNSCSPPTLFDAPLQAATIRKPPNSAEQKLNAEGNSVMRAFAKRVLRLAAVLATIPATFIGVLFGWHRVDAAVGFREVTAFIEQHNKIVDDWRRNPKVYSLSLSHDPNQAGTLRIQFDVEDKRTYEMIEDVLFKETSGMRFPPSWDTNLRSNEDLGNNWGFAAVGMGEALKAQARFSIAAFVSIFVCGVSSFFAFLPTRSRIVGTA